jgi:DNA polymerase-3 subunit gamma/tau
MFENVLQQEAVKQLSVDIQSHMLAPSMLFAGPPASGKGTAALELGRVLSCEQDTPGPPGSWNCPCPSCARHRLLYHPDLLALGSRHFSPEIAAAAEVFVKESAETPAQILFIRAVRKLLLRFNQILWEDDPRLSKLSPLLEGLEADLDEIVSGEASGNSNGMAAESAAWAEKLAASVRKNAFKLEADGMADQVPVSQIRHASYWMRLAPQGRRKLLLIENADRMQDAARNALLKILEEPPGRAVIVLASARAPALLPTILSRLRPYRFSRRDEAVEKDVIRRVFRGVQNPASPAGTNSVTVGRTGAGLGDSLITSYLESFLPVSGEKLYPLAAFFAASLAAQALLRKGRPSQAAYEAEIIALGKYTAPIAESAGYGRPAKEAGACIRTVLSGAEGFETPGLFNRFLARLLSLVSRSLRGDSAPAPENAIGGGSVLADIFRELAAEAASAVGTYNLAPDLTLEKMCVDFTQRVLKNH